MPPVLICNKIDGYELSLVPAGKAIFGSRADDPEADDREKPQFEAALPAFYLGLYPVTNKQYLLFVQATGHRAPDDVDYGPQVWRGQSFPQEKADHPVVCVSWDDAQAYCAWSASAQRAGVGEGRPAQRGFGVPVGERVGCDGVSERQQPRQ